MLSAREATRHSIARHDTLRHGGRSEAIPSLVLSYDGRMATDWTPPTRDGRSSGIDPTSSLAWAIEPPEVHWAEHDARQVAYWRSRPAAERLAQANHYRLRVHGLVVPPERWTWKLVPPYK